jgi:hypothetical protein
MSGTRRENDRRDSVRFDVVGSLRGNVAGRQHVQIHNIGAGGALIESHWPLPLGARVSLKLWTLESQIEANVLYVSRLAAEGYLIGVAFSSPDSALLQQLDGLLSPGT